MFLTFNKNKLHGTSTDTPQGLVYNAEQFRRLYEDLGTRKEDTVAVTKLPQSYLTGLHQQQEFTN